MRDRWYRSVEPINIGGTIGNTLQLYLEWMNEIVGIDRNRFNIEVQQKIK